ncbi:MAG: hypothetical protein CMJ64_23845 [Planctomycetaceae bacterium]|nr:hypothetical protein [Planctomycetaceae bacterium]
MLHNSELAVFAVAFLVQVAGFVSVGIARVGQQPDSQVGYERFFFLCMMLVAVISLLAMWSGTGSWLMNGITLAMMAVGATLDTGRGTLADSI